MNTANNIKDVVREKYGEAARRVGTGAKGGCCGTSTSCCTDPITSNLYDAAQAGEIPDDALAAQQIATLSQQLAWLQRQVFGQKSERRLVDNPDQLGLEALLGDAAPAAPVVPTQEIHYTRRVPKARDAACVTDAGLRFGPDVPVEVIELPAPQLQGPDAEQYEVIDHKVTRRLAPRPGSYVVLEYRRPVVKHKATATLREVAAPRAVFENSLADVSVLAGLLVDKFVYPLPLYHQPPRLAAAGITLSRTTLTSYVQRAIDLLVPIAKAQHAHILKSQVPPGARVLAGEGALMVTAGERNADWPASAEVLTLPDAEGRVDLAALMTLLGKRGINELHVEAGARLNGALLAAGLVDELVVYLAPCLIFDPALGMAQLPEGLARLTDRVPLEFEEVTPLGADLRLRLRTIAKEH